MKRKLILVTMDYYDNGANDPFIEPEIPHLLEHFDVTVISVKHKSSNSMNLPSEYRLLSLPNNTFFGKVSGVLSTIWSPVVRSEVAKIWSSRHYTLMLHLMCAHVVARGNSLYKILGSIIQTGDEEPILLYAYWLLPNILLPMARIKATNPRVQIIARVHSGEVYEYMHSPPYIPYLDTVSQIAKRLYFISENALNHFHARYPNAPAELAISRLGIRSAHSTYNRGSADGVFRIVSCSELKPNKNVEKIIEALSLIEDSKMEWTHFGGGQQERKIHALASKKLASKSNMSYRLVGRVPNHVVLEHYAKNPVDLFVNVSTAEGIPVSVMEAMANAIPVLATDVGGTSEIVNNENGELVVKGISANSLREKMEFFTRLEASEMEKRRNAAVRTWRELYNADANQQAFAGDIRKTIIF